eukprot:1996399-Rhodomonas_salina.2
MSKERRQTRRWQSIRTGKRSLPHERASSRILARALVREPWAAPPGRRAMMVIRSSPSPEGSKETPTPLLQVPARLGPCQC